MCLEVSMPDLMLFGEGWRGEKRYHEYIENGGVYSYLSKIEFTQNQLERAAPEPLDFRHNFNVTTFNSRNGNSYLMACKDILPADEDIEIAIISHRPSPIE